MTLYEQDPRIAEIMAMVDPDTGEWLGEEAFLSLHMEEEKKTESLILEYKNLNALSASIREEIKALSSRAASLDKQAENKRNYIAFRLNGEKFETARCSVRYRASESVTWDDTEKVIDWAESSGHADCLSYKPPEVLKTRLKDFIKESVEIPGGVRIEKKRNMVVK